MRPEDYKISKEKLQFSQVENNIHDEKLKTKPVGYLKDAFYRFRKNKASIVASIIIIALILFAIVVPIFSNYRVSYSEDSKYPYMKYALPKNKLFTKLGIDFWDGCQSNEISEAQFWEYQAFYEETGHQIIKNNEYEIIKKSNAIFEKTQYKVRKDSYFSEGFFILTMTDEEYIRLQKYQLDTGHQVIYPFVEVSSQQLTGGGNANIWYKTEKGSLPDFDKDGNFIPIYRKYDGNDNYDSLRIASENGEKLYSYAKKVEGGWNVRMCYYDYYIYYNKVVYNEGVTEPVFLFGTTSYGQDILTCLSSGARFSLLLSLAVATVNLVVGAIIGAIEGYYGGKVDLIIERFIEILSSVPMMIVITLLKYHLNASHIVILFLAFFITGWTGMAGRTRMQFYRNKNQEYVLVARTLGASDKRIMFKHIFPNSIGTLITSSVLIIPGVIFSETSLSYLGIINLESGNLISVGTLLGKGDSTTLISYPHIILFPALFISLLELSFNLFGNGLRDAFNPSLRGTED